MTDLSNPPLALMTSPSIADEGRPIDVAHLAQMTLRERSLEIQVLELFDRQAELLLARMREVAPSGVADLAHTLVGSARGIGAWRVAAAAEAVESAVAESGVLAPAIEKLDTAIGEARLAICAMLRVTTAAGATPR
jgi:hypothetical protein